MTLMIQSSSATIGLLIAVASTGALSLAVAFPILFGDNIGTCITALLSSIGANRTAKRAARITSYNVCYTKLLRVEWDFHTVI